MSMKFYTRMEHMIISEKMTLTVFRLLFVNRFLEEIHFELPSLKMFIKSVLIFFYQFQPHRFKNFILIKNIVRPSHVL